jgi:hypothetical protein
MRMRPTKLVILGNPKGGNTSHERLAQHRNAGCGDAIANRAVSRQC